MRLFVLIASILGVCLLSACDKADGASAEKQEAETVDKAPAPADKAAAAEPKGAVTAPVRVIEAPEELGDLTGWTHIWGSDDVYAVSATKPYVAHFKHRKQGKLEFVGKSKLQWKGAGSGGLQVTAGGQELWVHKKGDETPAPVAIIGRDPMTGDLFDSGEAQYQVAVGQVVVSPGGSFLYGAAPNGGGLVVAERKALAFEKVESVLNEAGVRAFAMGGDGKHLYVATSGAKSSETSAGLYVFERDEKTGKLTQVEKYTDKLGEVDLTNGALTALAMGPEDKRLFGFYGADGGGSAQLVAMSRDSTSGKVSFEKATAIGLEDKAKKELGASEMLVIDGHIFVDVDALSGPAVYALD